MNEEKNKKENLFTKKPWIKSLSILIVIFGTVLTFLYWKSVQGTVFIENSQLVAPVIKISPLVPGNLNTLYVKNGDVVLPNSNVALVGTSILTSKEGGVVASAPDALGGYFVPGSTVVSIIKRSEMKVVGALEENKGLRYISPGQRASFTIDAFPGKKYSGFVDEVGTTSDETGMVFSISDSRPIKKFDVTVRFNPDLYPELKNGMSAKITVYTE